MMGILTLLLAIVALVVSLVSVWFVSVMVKRANIVNRQFYEGNVRGSIKLLEDLTRSMEAALHTAGKLEKAEKKDLEKKLWALESKSSRTRPWNCGRRSINWRGIFRIARNKCFS